MTTNEPTTGEIIRNFRGAHIFGITQALEDRVADRLESQEREIERLNEELDEMQEAATVLHAANETHWTYIKELTARAESAERERDAAIGHIHDAIFGTNHSCFYCTMENCDGCTNSTVRKHFTYRGLLPNKYLTQQDGGAE